MDRVTRWIAKGGRGLLACGIMTVGCVSGPGQSTPKPPKNAELIALPYPEADLTVGAMHRAKEANGVPIETMLPESAFNRAFLSSVHCRPAAWAKISDQKQFAASVTAQPGPSVLAAIKAASPEGSAGVSTKKVQCLNWGELEECDVPLQVLSEAIVRRWHGLGGAMLGTSALSSMPLHMDPLPKCPWIVYRSMRANGIEYTLDKELALNLSAKVGATLYASGQGSLSYTRKNETTLKANQPMVIGYDLVRLVKVQPAFQYEVGKIQPADILTTYVFTWEVGRKGKKQTRIVDGVALRQQEALQAAESALPSGTAEKLTASVQQGEPVSMMVIAEAKPRSAEAGETGWRRIDEGFYGDELVRLRIALDQPAYVYLLNKDSTGDAYVLYPKTEGEKFSNGEEKALEKGMHIFPNFAGIKNEGMIFDPKDAAGKESFMVVASKKQLPELSKKMAEFAAAGRAHKISAPNSKTNQWVSGDLKLPAATRTIVGFGDPNTGMKTEMKTEAKEPLFSGVGSATVITLNLERQPR
jgi:hypothetical protein